MDNFDLRKYLAEGRLTEKKEKKQKFNAKLDDTLGGKDGAESTKKQDMKQRRADSENMEKAKGKRKYSSDKNMDKKPKNESAIAVAAGVASIFGGAVAADKAMDALEAGKLGEKGKAFAKFLRQAGSAAGDVTQVREEDVEEGYGKPMYDEDDTDAKNESKKGRMKVSELKAKIREDILSTLNEDEDVDVDVDFEDEVNIDAEGDDIEIERPAVKAKVNVGLSPEEEIIQDSLKAAMDAANALGNDKLADQVGNTITFFTREYVVGDRND